MALRCVFCGHRLTWRDQVAAGIGVLARVCRYCVDIPDQYEEAKAA